VDLIPEDGLIRVMERIRLHTVVIDRGHTTPCFIYEKSRTAAGYGQAWVGKKNYYVHRLAWLEEHGSWPEREIDHLCRQRACWNPDHLDEQHGRYLVRECKTCASDKQRVRRARGAR